MNVYEAMEKAATERLVVNKSISGVTEIYKVGSKWAVDDPDVIALLAHWYNHGPKLLEALNKAFDKLHWLDQCAIAAIIAAAEEVEGI